MPDHIDELVAAIDANTLYHDGSDPAHDAAVELASIARGHILESVRQRAEAEQLRQQRDAARAILADALNAMRDLGAPEDGTPADFRAWKAYQDGAMLLGWCIDPAYASDEAAES